MEAPSGAVPQFLNGSAIMWPFTLLHCSAVYVTPECRSAYPACPLGVHHIPVKPSVFSVETYCSPFCSHAHFTCVLHGADSASLLHVIESSQRHWAVCVIMMPILQMRTLNNRRSKWLAQVSTAKNGSHNLKFMQSWAQARPVSSSAKSVSSCLLTPVGQASQCPSGGVSFGFRKLSGRADMGGGKWECGVVPGTGELREGGDYCQLLT